MGPTFCAYYKDFLVYVHVCNVKNCVYSNQDPNKFTTLQQVNMTFKIPKMLLIKSFPGERNFWTPALILQLTVE